jgi:hypothetical protein
MEYVRRLIDDCPIPARRSGDLCVVPDDAIQEQRLQELRIDGLSPYGELGDPLEQA